MTMLDFYDLLCHLGNLCVFVRNLRFVISNNGTLGNLRDIVRIVRFATGIYNESFAPQIGNARAFIFLLDLNCLASAFLKTTLEKYKRAAFPTVTSEQVHNKISKKWQATTRS